MSKKSKKIGCIKGTIFITTLLIAVADLVLDWMAYTEFSRIDLTYQHESQDLLRDVHLAANILGTILFVGQLMFVVVCFRSGKSYQTVYVFITLVEEILEDLPIAVVTMLAWMRGVCNESVSSSTYTIVSRSVSIASVFYTFGRALFEAIRNHRKVRKYHFDSKDKKRAQKITNLRFWLTVIAFLVMFTSLFIDCTVLDVLITKDVSFVQTLYNILHPNQNNMITICGKL